MKAKERLIAALTEAKAPEAMIAKARAGEYDDIESEAATPIMNLVRDCTMAGLSEVAKRAIAGDFDCSAQEWRESNKMV